MNNVPESAYTETHGMLYFARMLSKIRFYAERTLREDFHENMGLKADAYCCNLLRVAYDDLKVRVLQGGTNEEILDWCYQSGRAANELDLLVWNNFCRKLGWNDFVSQRLSDLKEQSGLSDRDELQTMFEYFEYDEGRKP